MQANKGFEEVNFKYSPGPIRAKNYKKMAKFFKILQAGLRKEKRQENE